VSLSHHPSESVLADYVAGSMADGPGLVVSAHLERCAHCRARMELLEQVGGALIAELEPALMHDDALALALARIERPAPPAQPAPAPRAGPEGLTLPKALARRGIGARRFLAPGVWVAPVPSRQSDGWRTYLLRAPAGMAVLDHDHNGPEYTTLLRGAYHDNTGLYDEGDFAESAPGHSHHPTATPDAPCICLISGCGGISLSGWTRVVKPLLGV
jgi:putative transcriptional regulator